MEFWEFYFANSPMRKRSTVCITLAKMPRTKSKKKTVHPQPRHELSRNPFRLSTAGDGARNYPTWKIDEKNWPPTDSTGYNVGNLTWNNDHKPIPTSNRNWPDAGEQVHCLMGFVSANAVFLFAQWGDMWTGNPARKTSGNFKTPTSTKWWTELDG